MPSKKTVFHTTNTAGNAKISNLNVNGDYNITVSNTYQMTDEQEKDVFRWLAAPDSSANYHAAQEKHHDDTGLWFIEGEKFINWKGTPDLALWVYGTRCGKTIICSTAIHEILDHCAKKPTHACAYFFFDNRNGQNDLSLHNKFIRSVIRQLSHRSSGVPESLMEIYDGGHQQPSITSLQVTLRRIIESFEHTYIVIDALDECTERKKLLAWIEELMQWHGGKLHILMSSRLEVDITEKLDCMANLVHVSLKSSAINEDIKTYIDAMLLEMIRWDEKTRASVREVLIKGAGGMFRWVALQISELSKCCSRRAVDVQLKAMPKDLDATYEKMLMSSPNPRDLKQFLLWLAFSQETLENEELEDVIAVDFSSKEASFDPGLRYFGTTDMLDMCSGFIADRGYYFGPRYITLAHMSVKDYLISERIKSGPASYFSINAMLSHLTITQTCLACLLHLGTFSPIDETTVDSFPLARYAAKFWIAHMRLGSAIDDEHVLRMIDRLFSPKGNALINSVRLNNPDDNYPGQNMSSKTAPPLYYASSYGLEETVKRLMTNGVDVAARGGKYGNALQAASHHGHDRIVKSLLDYGADVHAQGGEYGSALQAAASDPGNVEVLRLLFEHGADVNAQGGEQGNALQIASRCGVVELVQLLLDRGGDVNTQGGFGGNALQTAAFHGYVEILQLFLAHGADVNAQGGHFGNAIQAAFAGYKGPVEVIQLLLDRGADVNSPGRFLGEPLQFAACRGYITFIQLLLDHGADVNGKGGEFGRALQAASYMDQVKCVQLLLYHGADVNTKGGNFGSALQAAAASYPGTVEIVQLLLDRGANVNAQGGKYGNALQAAACSGHIEVVHLLLDRGADVNVQGGYFRNFFQFAENKSHFEFLLLLLDHGANANAQGREFSSALQSAAYKGRVEIVQLLLAHGADVNTQGGHCGNALEAASQRGQETVVRLLLEHGADVNAMGGRYGTAIAAASSGCHTDIVQLLISKGANVQAQSARALRFARGLERDLNSDFIDFEISRKDCHATVQLLLDWGTIAEGGGSISDSEEDEEHTGSDSEEEADEENGWYSAEEE